MGPNGEIQQIPIQLSQQQLQVKPLPSHSLEWLLFFCLIDCFLLIFCFIDWLFVWLFDWFFVSLIDWLFDCFVWMVDWFIDWLIIWLFIYLIDRLISWLVPQTNTDCSYGKCDIFHCVQLEYTTNQQTSAFRELLGSFGLKIWIKFYLSCYKL